MNDNNGNINIPKFYKKKSYEIPKNKRSKQTNTKTSTHRHMEGDRRLPPPQLLRDQHLRVVARQDNRRRIICGKC